MYFDIMLPLIVSLVLAAIVFLYSRFETRLKSLFEEREFRIRDAILLVIVMGIMVTILALVTQFIPNQAILILFLAAYSFILFLFTYTAVEKWYLALLPPISFVISYFFFWDIHFPLFLNIFAILFAISISIYIGSLFSWKTVLVFAGLIAIMDIIQVFGTKHMGEAASIFITLRLPVLLRVPTFPLQGTILLGLGDIFLGGLLAIQTMRKYGKRAGFLSSLSIGGAFFIFETMIFQFEELSRIFPATLVVICGWLLSLGFYHVFKRKWT